MRDFRTLQVWDKAHRLALAAYEATDNFPACERFGMTSQIRRAAASIPANIAEGCGRGSKKDFARFLNIATGSASEVEYFLILAKDLRLIPSADFAALTAEVVQVKKMLSTLISRLTTDG